MRYSFHALLLIFFIHLTLSSSCTEDITERATAVVTSLEEVQLVKAVFLDGHNGIIQLRHDIAGGLDENGLKKESYFIRIGGDQNSYIGSGNSVTINEDLKLHLSDGYAASRNDPKIPPLFGRTISVQVSNDGQRNNMTDLPIEAGRAPDVLNSNLGFLPGGLVEGSRIIWNVDPLFEGEVYLIGEYFPQLNNGQIASAYPVGSIDYIAIPDSEGEYVFNLSDFSHLPPSGTMYFTLMRGIATRIDSDVMGTDIVLAYSTNNVISDL